ncbi:hypothetical protein Taro_046907 [Colocasia esculenta]|uniref:Retrotransposon gag domain-containing protein n=1 Tax=Colocasia esculenta TaxID=4460 RepID=A0A843WTS0_COLES|nr:hypothetical protein [Colocasia esculenta]
MSHRRRHRAPSPEKKKERPLFLGEEREGRKGKKGKGETGQGFLASGPQNTTGRGVALPTLRRFFALVLEERKEGQGRVLQSSCVRSEGSETKVEHPATRSEASLSRRTVLEADLEWLKSVKGTALLPRLWRLVDAEELVRPGVMSQWETQAQTIAALQAQASAQEAGFEGVSMMERFRRMTPPFFKGESDPILAKSWLWETENIFRAIRCAEEERVTLATYMLQGSMSVLEYEARFAELSKYAPHIVADEWRKVKKFIMGLKPSLRMRLVALGHHSMEEALSAACVQEAEMEMYLEEKRAYLKRPASAFQRQDRKKKAPAFQQRAVVLARVAALTPGVDKVAEKPLCTQCGKRHGGEVCWATSGRCLRCGDKNHKIRDYPKMAQ